MKKLGFLLLLFIVCFTNIEAQTDSILTIKKFINLYGQYEKECYADTFQIGTTYIIEEDEYTASTKDVFPSYGVAVNYKPNFYLGYYTFEEFERQNKKPKHFIRTVPITEHRDISPKGFVEYLKRIEEESEFIKKDERDLKEIIELSKQRIKEHLQLNIKEADSSGFYPSFVDSSNSLNKSIYGVAKKITAAESLAVKPLKIFWSSAEKLFQMANRCFYISLGLREDGSMVWRIFDQSPGYRTFNFYSAWLEGDELTDAFKKELIRKNPYNKKETPMK
jgi:hypothetical protein